MFWGQFFHFISFKKKKFCGIAHSKYKNNKIGSKLANWHIKNDFVDIIKLFKSNASKLPQGISLLVNYKI